MSISFSEPFVSGREMEYIAKVFENGHFQGNGEFTKRAHELLEQSFGDSKGLLTPSCTGALEMSSMLLGAGSGDEVIMPSFTFSTTASSFMRSGVKPVFCEIDPESFQIDLEDVKRKITRKTVGVVPVHYGGFSCDMEKLVKLCDEQEIFVVEDCAQGLGSNFRGKSLGTFGEIGAISFHETKNIHCGLGGCIIINDKTLYDRSEIIWERGTNRSEFFKGIVDKYTWKEVGSSFYPTELQAAFLLAQLEKISENMERRKYLWEAYSEGLYDLEKEGTIGVLRGIDGSEGNAHMFSIILRSREEADALRKSLNSDGIQAVIHYVPLHDSPVGISLGYSPSDLPVTIEMASRIIRLPLHNNLQSKDCEEVINRIIYALT